MANSSTAAGVPRELTAQNRQGRAGVTPASSIPRIQFSTGTAKALKDFSFDMFQASSRIEDELDNQAQAEGTVEGAAAGASGDFETVDYTTIRGRAYNQAGIQTFVSGLETRSILATAEIQSQFYNDPEVMRGALDDYHKGIAGELNEVSPGAGAAYLQRAAMRSVPAVEAARDAQFAMTRDQANAALIESQVALDAEMTTHSANLFSDNPARSQAAASALAVVGQEIMRVYDAVDPTTGRPLYSAAEKAKARAGFNERVFETATLSWFEGQEDKSAAYTKFIEGDFSFDMNVDQADVEIVDMTGGKIRNKPITKHVRSRISAAAVATGSDISIALVSGGQDAKGFGTRRTGSTRHDHGEAGDIVLMKDGQQVLPGEDPALYERFIENAAAAGFTGIGHYEWGIHVGGGKSAAWGPSTTGRDLDPRFGAAIARGRANPMDTEGGKQSVDMRKTMSPSAMKRLESEMRSQITFKNTQADRATREEEKAHADRQEIGFTLALDSYLNGGKVEGTDPLTRPMIQEMLERQEISFAQSRQALQWLATPAPEASNQSVFEELQRRMYEGDDISGDIQSMLGQLSKADATSLLGKNQSMNSEKTSTMTEEQRGYLGMIRQTVAPEGILAQLDDGASMRAFNAQDEYRKRISEGEAPPVVAREIIDRAQRDTLANETFALQRMLRPRFAVSSASGDGIDVRQSAVLLDAARVSGGISEVSYKRQRKLIMEWAKIQGDTN
tara:strand:- start:3406 stop:5601 length:2196 start_codon:yes stop_codon:yes gene_type:complete